MNVNADEIYAFLIEAEANGCNTLLALVEACSLIGMPITEEEGRSILEYAFNTEILMRRIAFSAMLLDVWEENDYM